MRGGRGGKIEFFKKRFFTKKSKGGVGGKYRQLWKNRVFQKTIFY
jgi:hypothetical protein